MNNSDESTTLSRGRYRRYFDENQKGKSLLQNIGMIIFLSLLYPMIITMMSGHGSIVGLISIMCIIGIVVSSMLMISVFINILDEIDSEKV